MRSIAAPTKTACPNCDAPIAAGQTAVKRGGSSRPICCACAGRLYNPVAPREIKMRPRLSVEELFRYDD